MSKTKTKYTDDAIMQLITSGTTTKLEELTILWKDDRHVLVKFAGGKYWAGIGMEGYAPMRVEIRSFRNSKRTGRAVHEGGRLTKAIREKLIAKAKRQRAHHIGADAPKQKIQGGGFQKRQKRGRIKLENTLPPPPLMRGKTDE